MAVDIDKRQSIGRRDDDAICHDHESRIRALEKSYDHLVIRIDRYDATLHGIEKAVNALQNEMESHTELMRSHIDLAFRSHEIQEMQMHKDMLIKAIQSVIWFILLLASAIGGMGWWIFQHVTGLS